MKRRLYLIDSESLYSTSQAHYKGKLDFSFLWGRLGAESADAPFDAVVFHAEPRNSSSDAFQSLLRNLGYQLVVIPPRVVGKSDIRSVPVHLTSYAYEKFSEYGYFDFISGDVDYSPVASSFVAKKAHVRLWVFADRIPTFGQDEHVSNGIIPINESFILSQQSYLDKIEDYSQRTVEILESPHEGAGVVEVGDSTDHRKPRPSPPTSKVKEAYERAATRSEKVSFGLDLGVHSDTGCEDI